MEVPKLVLNSLDRVWAVLLKATDNLTQEELSQRPSDQAAPVGWLVWHMARIEDQVVRGYVRVAIQEHRHSEVPLGALNGVGADSKVVEFREFHDRSPLSFLRDCRSQEEVGQGVPFAGHLRERSPKLAARGLKVSSSIQQQ